MPVIDIVTRLIPLVGGDPLGLGAFFEWLVSLF